MARKESLTGISMSSRKKLAFESACRNALADVDLLQFEEQALFS